MNSRFGASELRLNILESSLPLEYPVNVYSDVFEPSIANSYGEVAALAEKGAWDEVLCLLEEKQWLINSCRLRKRGEEEAGEALWTPLHRAACCPEAGPGVLSSLLGLGALRSLCTGGGETPWDVAVRVGREQQVLDLLEVPEAVTAHKDCIQRMAATVHRIIVERAGELVERNGLSLPQIQMLWEISNTGGESLMFPVLGMRGGFSLDLDLDLEEGEEGTKLYVVSWSRAADSEEVRHVVDSSGQARDISDVLDELRNELGGGHGGQGGQGQAAATD